MEGRVRGRRPWRRRCHLAAVFACAATLAFVDTGALGSDGQREGGIGHFDSPKYNRLMRQAGALQGRPRYERYGALDVELARDAGPLAALSFFNEPTLVSRRVGCVVLRPTLDLTAVCLK